MDDLCIDICSCSFKRNTLECHKIGTTQLQCRVIGTVGNRRCQTYFHLRAVFANALKYDRTINTHTWQLGNSQLFIESAIIYIKCNCTTNATLCHGCNGLTKRFIIGNIGIAYGIGTRHGRILGLF